MVLRQGFSLVLVSAAIGVVALLVAEAVLASYLPARQATRISADHASDARLRTEDRRHLGEADPLGPGAAGHFRHLARRGRRTA
jgi:hypothetical protein